MAVAPLRELPLDEFEVILLLRRKETARLVVLADLSVQIDAVLKRPQEIYLGPPRRFEELVAFALSKSGYEDVQLTPLTRDGGYDIEAIRKWPTRERLIVECKRYSESNKVGRPTLDALLGVLHREKANQALLATTSSFSKDALELFAQEPWRLQGMDIHEIMRLLRKVRRN
jgi:restriction endonuclease Mrr